MDKYEMALNDVRESIEMLNRHTKDGSFSYPYYSLSVLKELVDKEKFRNIFYECFERSKNG